MCPTVPAPMISVRSTNAGLVQTTARTTQRQSGMTATLSAQKAISVATGAAAPRARTSATRSAQAPTVNAETPCRASVTLAPPMPRPGSR